MSLGKWLQAACETFVKSGLLRRLLRISRSLQFWFGRGDLEIGDGGFELFNVTQDDFGLPRVLK